MQFSNPDALWAFLALPIPVLIHLFNLQKTERIVFANNRLLEEVVQKTNKSRQVQNLLLLLARLLAFAFLILAFAQPNFQSKDQTETAAREKTAFFLDNSPSMFFPDDGNRAFEKALGIARGKAEAAGPNSWYLLAANQLSGKHTWTSPSAFKDQLLDVAPSAESRTFAVLENRLLRDLSGFKNELNGKMVFVSDFQKNRYFQPADLFRDSSRRIELLAIAHKSISNVWIDSAWLPEPIQLDGSENTIRFRLRYSSAMKQQKIRTQFLSSKGLLSGKVISTGNGEPVVGSMPFRISPNQKLNAWLEVEDPETRFDNRFYISIQAPEPVQVYAISSEPASLMKMAFSASPLFRFSQSNPTEPDYAMLEKADLIILEGISEPGSALQNRISERIQNGASLLLVPGKTGSISKVLASEAGIQISDILLKNKSEEKINLPGKGQTFFDNIFQEDPGAKVKPNAVPVVSLKGVSPVLQFESGEVFAGKNGLGKGTIWTVASPFQEGFGSLTRHPIFIPLLYKIGFTAEPSSLPRLYVAPGAEFIRFPMDSTVQFGDQAVELQNESGQKILSEIQAIGDQFQVRIPQEPSLSEGFWNIRQKGKNLGSFAMNRDGEESVPEFYSGEELVQLFKDRPWVSVQSIGAEAAASHLETDSVGQFPIWKVCVLLAILMFALEILIIRLKRNTVIT